jgi:hypothetical protein
LRAENKSLRSNGKKTGVQESQDVELLTGQIREL